ALSRQDRDRALARGDAGGPSRRFQDDRHDHVWACRRLCSLGASSVALAYAPIRDWGIYRVRAVALCPYGSTDLSEGTRASWPDLPRGGADARGRAAGIASLRDEHPDLMGQDGTGWREDVSARRG